MTLGPGVVWLALAALLLGGCASAPPADLLWRLKGKLSLTAQNDTRLLTLDWRRSPDSSQLILRGPLGLKVATLRLTAAETLLVDGEQQDAQLLQAKGQSLPLNLLLDWFDQAFQGQATPEHTAGPWRLAVLRYQNEKPSLLELTHPTLSLRLRIKSWT